MQRCPWCEGFDLYREYHDTEWGVPLRDDRALFELINLEGAQAGLSWSTVLRKRETYRAAFDQFDPEKIARYDERKVAELLGERDEELEAWTVPEVWVMGGTKPNTHVDVTDQVDRKIRALLCHETQHQDPSGVEVRVRGWMGMTAQHFGLPEGRLAEAFQVVDTR